MCDKRQTQTREEYQNPFWVFYTLKKQQQTNKKKTRAEQFGAQIAHCSVHLRPPKRRETKLSENTNCKATTAIAMDAQAQQTQEQQQQQTSTKVFTVVETRHLLKILMNPKTLAMFKDNKQSHAFVWNYIFKCMKLKFPKFAKSTRQCYKKWVCKRIEAMDEWHRQAVGVTGDCVCECFFTRLVCFCRYENLKGKYFEIKRAQMNGEQRPYWLYYNEMDYIISHFPGHRPRINLDAGNSVSATSTPNSANNSSMDGSTTATNTNQTEYVDIKPTRSASISAINMDSSKWRLWCFKSSKFRAKRSRNFILLQSFFFINWINWRWTIAIEGSYVKNAKKLS